MRLRGWSAKETASRFVVHPNTIRNWKRALRDKHRAESLVGAPPWNKLHAGVRWLVHEIRTLCPERDFGTRTMARHLMRAGIQISRTSVRRILEEDRPTRAARCPNINSRAHTTAPEHFSRPPRPNHVWHMDLTTFRVLWMRCEVAAVIDGFSRKIVGLKAFRGTPTTADLVHLVDCAIQKSSAPRFIITDHGGQFQTSFHGALAGRGIKHARGRVRSWQFNAKVERLFWSLKRWGRLVFHVPDGGAIQGCLDAYATWHNLYRPHAAHGVLAPSEAARGAVYREAIRYTEGGGLEPGVRIRREHVGDDPRLFYPVIEVVPRHRTVA